MKKAWIYQRKDSGKFDVYYWQNGRKTWAGGLPSKRLATQALNLCIQHINTNVFGYSIKVDLDYALSEFNRKYKMEKASASSTKTERALKRFFDFVGNHKPSEYKHHHFLDYAESRGKTACGSTVRYDLITARSFFRYCKDAGYISAVPEIPNIQPSRTKQGGAVAVDEIVRFCGVADADTRLSCLVGLITGLRTMDVRCLTGGNVKGQYIETVAKKTQKQTKCYLPPLLWNAMKDFKGFQKISQKAFQDRVNKYSTGWTFHDLRRTHAQLIRDFDSSLIFAQESLGHSSVKTTRDFYATSNAIMIDRVFTPILEKICTQ